MITFRLLATVVLLLPNLLLAQTPPKPAPIRYILPQGKGSLIPPIEGWKPAELHLLDNNTRFAIQLKGDHGLIASQILFPNKTGSATSESCRQAVMGPVLDQVKSAGTIVEEPRSVFTNHDGQKLVVSSYRITKLGTVPVQQQNVFAFYGTADTCFETHLSKTNYVLSDKPLFDSALRTFRFEPDFNPSPADYGVVATIFFNYIHDFPSARIYYQRAYDTMPKADLTAPTATPLGRVTVIQLSLACGLTGDLACTRSINEAAIARDPDFPMYYYELADADAEQGDAAAAQKHLQQAFDRRANLPPNLPMPDPTQDDSLLKLKDNTAFWSFVTSLPRS
jgi:tetratricopeptide (TPR) repeat protein